MELSVDIVDKNKFTSHGWDGRDLELGSSSKTLSGALDDTENK